MRAHRRPESHHLWAFRISSARQQGTQQSETLSMEFLITDQPNESIYFNTASNAAHNMLYATEEQLFHSPEQFCLLHAIVSCAGVEVGHWLSWSSGQATVRDRIKSGQTVEHLDHVDHCEQHEGYETVEMM